MQDLVLYIKQTMRRHESGYRVFECGYLLAEEGEKPTKKIVISEGTDHVATDVLGLADFNKAININLDLTLNGYIRIFTRSNKPIKWQCEDFGMSDMYIQFGQPLKDIENKDIEDAFVDIK